MFKVLPCPGISAGDLCLSAAAPAAPDCRGRLGQGAGADGATLQARPGFGKQPCGEMHALQTGPSSAGNRKVPPPSLVSLCSSGSPTTWREGGGQVGGQGHLPSPGLTWMEQPRTPLSHPRPCSTKGLAFITKTVSLISTPPDAFKRSNCLIAIILGGLTELPGCF